MFNCMSNPITYNYFAAHAGMGMYGDYYLMKNVPNN